MYTQKKNKRTPSYTRKMRILLFCGLAVILLACVGITTLEYTNTTYFFHKRPATHETQPNTPSRTANSNTKGEPTTQTTPPGTDDSDKNPTTPSTPTTGNLLEPTGNFVSNHRPKDNSAEQQAVCVTTPGALCEIIFTNGSLTHSLPAQTTDAGGATYWTWSPVSAGLTAGTWKVQAKAVLQGQTKTATDATDLEIN